MITYFFTIIFSHNNCFYITTLPVYIPKNNTITDTSIKSLQVSNHNNGYKYQIIRPRGFSVICIIRMPIMDHYGCKLYTCTTAVCIEQGLYSKIFIEYLIRQDRTYQSISLWPVLRNDLVIGPGTHCLHLQHL